MALHASYATIWDYIHRGMPVGQEGSLQPDEGIRLSNAPVVWFRLVLNLSDERTGISTEAAESGRGGEAGCGV
jgi:hypothetical protein